MWNVSAQNPAFTTTNDGSRGCEPLPQLPAVKSVREVVVRSDGGRLSSQASIRVVWTGWSQGGIPLNTIIYIRKEIKFINKFLYDPFTQKVKSQKIPNLMKALLLRAACLKTGQGTNVAVNDANISSCWRNRYQAAKAYYRVICGVNVWHRHTGARCVKLKTPVVGAIAWKGHEKRLRNLSPSRNQSLWYVNTGNSL